eukprot:scaffold3782_cov170-Amphora_coffeaeformis.AAC.11
MIFAAGLVNSQKTKKGGAGQRVTKVYNERNQSDGPPIFGTTTTTTILHHHARRTGSCIMWNLDRTRSDALLS